MTDLRVVVDTNVLVSALLASGKPRQLLRLADAGGLVFTSCAALLDELDQVLRRPKIADRVAADDVRRFRTLVGRVVTVLPDPEVVPAATRDPDDDLLVALAKAAHADLICTGDSDLLEADIDVEVVTPAGLVQRLIGPEADP